MTDETCRGFHWAGQDFAHCENCGRDIRDHDGMWGGGKFGEGGHVISFPEFMVRSKMFTHYVTPKNAPRPYRWENYA